jgi:hypothetical protein
VARMGKDKKVYKVLVGNPEGKRPLGRPTRRWEDVIRMDLREIGLWGCGLDSTGSGQGPVAGCCECGDEPSGSCVTESVRCLINHIQRLATRYFSQTRDNTCSKNRLDLLQIGDRSCVCGVVLEITDSYHARRQSRKPSGHHY